MINYCKRINKQTKKFKLNLISLLLYFVPSETNKSEIIINIHLFSFFSTYYGVYANFCEMRNVMHRMKLNFFYKYFMKIIEV